MKHQAFARSFDDVMFCTLRWWSSITHHLDVVFLKTNHHIEQFKLVESEFSNQKNGFVTVLFFAMPYKRKGTYARSRRPLSKRAKILVSNFANGIRGKAKRNKLNRNFISKKAIVQSKRGIPRGWTRMKSDNEDFQITMNVPYNIDASDGSGGTTEHALDIGANTFKIIPDHCVGFVNRSFIFRQYRICGVTFKFTPTWTGRDVLTAAQDPNKDNCHMYIMKQSRMKESCLPTESDWRKAGIKPINLKHGRRVTTHCKAVAWSSVQFPSSTPGDELTEYYTARDAPFLPLHSGWHGLSRDNNFGSLFVYLADPPTFSRPKLQDISVAGGLINAKVNITATAVIQYRGLSKIT